LNNRRITSRNSANNLEDKERTIYNKDLKLSTQLVALGDHARNDNSKGHSQCERTVMCKCVSSFLKISFLRLALSKNERAEEARPAPIIVWSVLLRYTMGNQPTTPRVRKTPGTTVKYRPSPRATQARTYGYHACCVMRHRISYEPIPIESVDVSVNIVHSLAEITVKQLYHNDSTSPIECMYVNSLLFISRSLFSIL
jgi:hypothetical protein